MYTRPSKNFFFPILQKELSAIHNGVGLDAASAGMKNRHMFKTDVYIGLDIDRTLLESGLQKYPDEKTIGLHADITDLKGIPSDSIDVVASTNTLYVLSPEKRLVAMKELSRVTAPEGYLICEVPLIDDLAEEIKLLKYTFATVKVIYYKNPVSQAYEHFFERSGNLGSHPVADLLPFKMLSWLLGRLEYTTCRLSFLNKHAVMLCQYKKNNNQKQNFDLEKIQNISPRLYSLM